MNPSCTYLFEAWANNRPESQAFVDDRVYSYAEVDRYVAAYGAVLREKGIKPGDRLGIYMPNCIDYIFAYFGIVYAGAVAVPINSLLIDSEINYIVKDAGMALLISVRPAQVDCPVVLDREIRLLADEAARKELPPPHKGEADDVTTIIYTSGTTGSPKGAMLTHKSLLSNAFSVMDVYPFGPQDRMLAVLPLYHCFGFLFNAVLSMACGASSYIQKSFSPAEALRLVREENLTILCMVPPMYQLLARTTQPGDLASVKLAISGGASMPKAVAEAFEHVYGRRVVEGYGLSEASPVCCFNRPEKSKYYSVGPTISGVSARIVNETTREKCKIGEIGELLIQGPNVMKGYLNLPEATAEALQDGWLHTGDMAYEDQDGYIYIVDRVKDMINLNGENIYPREIENILYLHPDVAEAAVVGRKDTLRGEIVCAYLVMKDGAVLNQNGIRNFLKDKVAPYKMPRIFIQVDSLPKNNTGKTLKRLLD